MAHPSHAISPPAGPFLLPSPAPAPPPPHYAYSPAPGPPPYYPYPMPPMNAHPQMHPPASPRMNGAGRGRYNPHRGGAPAYHYQAMPPQHHIPPPAVPAQTPPPISPASPFHNPQKYAPHPHPHQVPYGSPYHHPQPNGPYPPAWAGQTLSPLPKQLSMLPPMASAENMPHLQLPQGPHHAPVQPQPPADVSPNLGPPPPPADLPPIVAAAEQEAVLEQQQAPEPEPSCAQPDVSQPESTASQEPVEIAESEQTPQQEEEAIAPESPNSAPIEDDEERRASTSRSPSPGPTPSTTLASSYVIWSRRPGDPTRAPGVIISTRAFPPEDILEKALEMRTPPATPKIQPTLLAPSSDPAPVDVHEHSPETHSSSTTETTPACSIAADTPVPGSPYSSATSVSVAVGSPSKTLVSPSTDAKIELPLAVEVPSQATEPSIPQPRSEVPVATASTSTPAAVPKPAPGPKKSWASLLQSSDSAASSSKPRLPVSTVVGFSIPAASGTIPSPTPGSSVASGNRNELLHLLNEGPLGSLSSAAASMKIRPRGLVNTGNMCFANAVLQILVYCPPFHRFFSELRRHLAGPVVGSQREGTKATPLVDATIQFLKEFVPDSPASSGDRNAKAKGKEREDDTFDELDSFIPTYVYDAMKEKKRFANMIGGYQEDAEEFLGFFLDTLEEELLSISQSLQQPKEAPQVANEEAPQDDGWMEVGKKNKAVMTRTARSTDSPITRIFGGKFRSALRAPHQRESVTIEDWRSLQLDIQPENVKSLRDALQHISHPQPVQISIPTRPGQILDATQQVLIDALPPVLILHMKRFLYDTKVGDVVKVGKQVSFSAELDIPSVLYHHGLSASGGHYTLDVLHPNRELSDRPRAAWIRIDDELVSDLRPEDVFGGQEREDRQPYLLFYRRMAGWGATRTN
ncbi:hypothetical protein C8Q80DRAFT_1171656 [Daedaleopsis nitida]|nr:hypothetical protein C8Q80DRAFT_1171656 [Daedaleopsis nitida]